MSVLKVDQIQDTAGGNTVTINGATPTVDNTMGRNRIINGDMRIDQRNAGASVSISTGSDVYTLDRWAAAGQSADGVFSVQQDTSAPASFTKSLKVTVTTADASIGSSQYYLVQQKIEGFNASDLAWGTASAKTVTLSFWVRSSLTGTFGGSLRNNASNRSYPFNYTISSADTWEQKSITIAGDTSGTWTTDNSSGVRLSFSLGMGSTFSGTAGAWAATNYASATGAVSVIGTLNATWYITGVQLEVGSVATPFERRPYGTELALCQRYYNRVVFGGSAGEGFLGFVDTTTGVIATYSAPVSMRAAPTLVTSGTAADYQIRRSGPAATTCSAVPTIGAHDSVQNFRIQATVSSGLTGGQAVMLNSGGATTFLAFNSEL